MAEPEFPPTKVTLFGCELEADEAIADDVIRMNPKTLALIKSVAFAMAIARETHGTVEIGGNDA